MLNVRRTEGDVVPPQAIGSGRVRDPTKTGANRPPAMGSDIGASRPWGLESWSTKNPSIIADVDLDECACEDEDSAVAHGHSAGVRRA